MGDFLNQMRSIKKLGGMGGLLKMLPMGGALGGALKNLPQGETLDKEVKKIEAIICSMTRAERDNPKILNGSRRLRIAKGSGHRVQDVNKLIKGFEQSKKDSESMDEKILNFKLA